MCAIPYSNCGLSELVVSVVWCVLLLSPRGMSAPTGRMIWVDPCGGHPVEGAAGERRTDAELLDAITVTAERALNRAKSFADAYVNDIDIILTGDTFPGRSMEQVNKEFPKSMFDWDEVSKRYGEPTPLNHYFRQIKNPLGDNLRRYYGHLQTIAIALEGTVHDMKRSRGKFADEFESLMHHLKQVLCEVLTGIGELGFADKIENKIQPIREEIKDETFRAVNNWVVFREYIMYMEYLIESCKFFKERYMPESE